MTEEIEILDFETCKLLKEVGFNDLCEYLHTTAVRHDGKDLSYWLHYACPNNPTVLTVGVVSRRIKTLY